MDRSKWEGKPHSTRRWLGKLAEEHGEVGKELSCANVSKREIKRAMVELEHVEFIARCFREDLERRLS